MTDTPTISTVRNRDFSAEAFMAWEKRHEFDWRRTAEVLGCAKNTIFQWRKKGAPYYIGLACAAVDHGLFMPETEEHLADPDAYVGPRRNPIASF